jgi:hypothetical protein
MILCNWCATVFISPELLDKTILRRALVSFLLDSFVKHDIKGVLKYRGKKLDLPFEPLPPSDVTDVKGSEEILTRFG